MPIEARIEPFSQRYAPQIFELILPIQTREYGIDITKDQQPDLAQIPIFYQTGNGNFWVALAPNVVVGTIGLKDIGNQQLALRKMFVHADHRGEAKVGKKLLDTAMAWSADHRIKDIFLGTTEFFEAAHRFYEKNGFVEIEKAELPPAFPVMAVDSKFYHYRLG